ncbi:hypothetical protein HDU76_012500 [Blyttiomyces sp. JEL0837]|nr:hypothetical protein HDU76_012500 [Blyttiomyces sp. JEL0837]
MASHNTQSTSTSTTISASTVSSEMLEFLDRKRMQLEESQRIIMQQQKLTQETLRNLLLFEDIDRTTDQNRMLLASQTHTVLPAIYQQPSNFVNNVEHPTSAAVIEEDDLRLLELDLFSMSDHNNTLGFAQDKFTHDLQHLPHNNDNHLQLYYDNQLQQQQQQQHHYTQPSNINQLSTPPGSISSSISTSDFADILQPWPPNTNLLNMDPPSNNIIDSLTCLPGQIEPSNTFPISPIGFNDDNFVTDTTALLHKQHAGPLNLDLFSAYNNSNFNILQQGNNNNNVFPSTQNDMFDIVKHATGTKETNSNDYLSLLMEIKAACETNERENEGDVGAMRNIINRTGLLQISGIEPIRTPNMINDFSPATISTLFQQTQSTPPSTNQPSISHNIAIPTTTIATLSKSQPTSQQTKKPRKVVQNNNPTTTSTSKMNRIASTIPSTKLQNGKRTIEQPINCIQCNSAMSTFILRGKASDFDYINGFGIVDCRKSKSKSKSGRGTKDFDDLVEVFGMQAVCRHCSRFGVADSSNGDAMFVGNVFESGGSDIMDGTLTTTTTGTPVSTRPITSSTSVIRKRARRAINFSKQKKKSLVDSGGGGGLNVDGNVEREFWAGLPRVLTCDVCSVDIGFGGVKVSTDSTSGVDSVHANENSANGTKGDDGIGPRGEDDQDVSSLDGYSIGCGEIGGASQLNLDDGVLAKRGLPFTVEIVCASCRVKYECGGGGKFRTGKYRPVELFPNNRRTCILSHARISDTQQIYRVFSGTTLVLSQNKALLAEVKKVCLENNLAYQATAAFLERIHKPNTTYEETMINAEKIWMDVINGCANSESDSKTRHVSRYMVVSYISRVSRRKKPVSQYDVHDVKDDGDNNDTIAETESMDIDSHNFTASLPTTSMHMGPTSNDFDIYAPDTSCAKDSSLSTTLLPSTLPSLTDHMVSAKLYFEWNRMNGTLRMVDISVLMMAFVKVQLTFEISVIALIHAQMERERWIKMSRGDSSLGKPRYYYHDSAGQNSSLSLPPITHIWAIVYNDILKLAEVVERCGMVTLSVYLEQNPDVDAKFFECRPSLDLDYTIYVINVKDLKF